MIGKSIIICVLLSLIKLSNGQDENLIAGHVLYRHGDRTPVTTFPADQVKEYEWPNGYGQLTKIGIEQQHRLGKFIRNRYQNLLSETYNRSEIFVRSTDVDRTLMSAESNLAGLFPVVDPVAENVPIQPIPIHTVSIDTDFLLGQNDCPMYDQLEIAIEQGEEMQNMTRYYQTFLKSLEQWTNKTNITIYNAWDIADTVFVEHLYNRTPSWASDDVRKNLSDINDLSFHFLYDNDDVKRIRGGPAVQDIWYNMNKTIGGGDHHKVRVYSAHDTTVSAVLAFLGINEPHQPQYASALFIDLYQSNSSYYVRVEYLMVTDSNTTKTYTLAGCVSINCTFENFTAIYRPRFPDTAMIECYVPYPTQPTPPDRTSQMETVLAFMIIGLFILIILIFLCVYVRKSDHKAFPIDNDEQTSVCV